MPDMSEVDRQKWEKRYREGAYAALSHPSACLVQAFAVIQPAAPRPSPAYPSQACSTPGSATDEQHCASAVSLSTVGNTIPAALDIACGAGRNSHWLASHGYQVDAVDISAEALARGRQHAEAAGLTGISWHQHDLDTGLPEAFSGYQLIIMMRYLDIALLQLSVARLLPGGYVLAEVHLQSDKAVAGPSGSAFRAEPGALQRAAHGLELIDYFEGVTIDPDGRQVALARLLAKKHS